MQQLAFMINQEDSTKFNQIKGKTMICYFSEQSSCIQIDVKGNGQTVYYARDKDNTDRCKHCTKLVILSLLLKDNKPDNIRFIYKAIGNTISAWTGPKRRIDPERF